MDIRILMLSYFFTVIASAFVPALIGLRVVTFTVNVFDVVCRVFGICALIFLALFAAMFCVGLVIAGGFTTPGEHILLISTAAFMPVAIASAAFMTGLDKQGKLQRKSNRVPGVVLAQQFREAYHAQLRAETQAKDQAQARADAEAQTQVDTHLVF